MTNITTLVDLMQAPAKLTQSRVPSGLLLDGNPLQTLSHHYISPCGQFSCGIWECTPGRWTIEYDESEYCEMLSGAAIVRDADGRERVLRAGDRFVIPPGFRGTWEVVETCRKIYASHVPLAGQPCA
ncbi:cupin domain-containing protein [Burkholderia cepacia]|uniref:cupin domain-containing protein n=1 Tax=Burkholderia cepacia TaxID=292 RepID=UPI000F5825DA|nr:cupin domain-containing protein [Burkholderia cepacia]MCA7994722.1 cupin domain-containing protein [Burkholderia cepacia]RQT67803.1 cupin domain-containing protein [Burkholderia cepacia]